MSSTRSFENNKLREELKKLKGALKDLQDDKLIEVKPDFETSINIRKQSDKLDSLHSEDIEKLCNFDKINDSKQELSESSLKSSKKYTGQKLDFFNKFESSQKYIKEPTYDPSAESPLKLNTDSQSEELEERHLKYSPFDKIQVYRDRNEEIALPPSLSSKSFSKESSAKFKTYDQQNLLDEIEKLRKENSSLREQLKTAQSSKTLKEPKFVGVSVKDISPKRCKIETEVKSGSKTPKKNVGRGRIGRSASRSKSKSLTPKDVSYKAGCSPLTPKRYRHCNVCDHLLMKGYSTKYCSKHGISINKIGNN